MAYVNIVKYIINISFWNLYVLLTEESKFGNPTRVLFVNAVVLVVMEIPMWLSLTFPYDSKQ